MTALMRIPAPRRRLWLTALLLAATLIAAAVTGSLHHPSVTNPHWLKLGLVNGPALHTWRVVKLIPTVAFTKGQGNVIGASWKILLFVGALEALTGTRRALLAFFATNAAGYLIAYLAIAWPLAALGYHWGHYWYFASDLGASAGCYGGGIIVTQLLPSPWRWLTVGGLLLFFATTLHPHGPVYIWDVEHISAMTLGFAIGVVWRWRNDLAQQRRPAPFIPVSGEP